MSKIIKYAARFGQLSALQNQMVSMAIEFGIDRATLVTETGKAYDDLLEAYSTAAVMIGAEDNNGKEKASA